MHQSLLELSQTIELIGTRIADHLARTDVLYESGACCQQTIYDLQHTQLMIDEVIFALRREPSAFSDGTLERQLLNDVQVQSDLLQMLSGELLSASISVERVFEPDLGRLEDEVLRFAFNWKQDPRTIPRVKQASHGFQVPGETRPLPSVRMTQRQGQAC